MPERLNSKKRLAVSMDLGLMEYKRALDLQVKTLESKINRVIFEDRLFFVEHPPVFTLGKRGGEENLTVSKAFLKSKHMDIVQTDRGGNITYHGPGQAILYPVIDLYTHRIGVKDFVWGLEEIMKRTALDFNIDAKRNPLNHGIWVGDAKLGSVGISVKKGICFHGLAMNINLDLEPFSWIFPCGLPHVSMTSIKNQNQDHPSMKKIKQAFLEHFSSVFNFEIKEQDAY